MKQQPPTLPLPAQWQRCEGVGIYVCDTCHLAESCARYLTIPLDQPPITPMVRACFSDTMAMYIPMDGFPEDIE
ncbi:MAG: hypothetical protein KA440_08460 [Azonexus sp.]|nr:hypothetical protein [Azonexus sp.]